MRLRRHNHKPAHEETSVSRAGRRKKRLWIAADVVAVTAVGGLWWRWLNVVPNVNIPAPPPLPSPNAFDTFTKASGLMVEKDAIDSASSKPDQLPSERNGVLYSEKEKAAIVAANAKALTTLRSGFSQQYQGPSRRGFEALFPELAPSRKMARLLNLEGQVREANGDFGGAAQSRLDAMRLGVEVPRGGVLIHYLVGVACEKIGSRPLWALVDKLSAEEARTAAKRLEEITARRVSLADVLQEEKWFMQDGLLKELRKRNTFQFLREMMSSWTEDSDSEGVSLDLGKTASLTLWSLKTSKTQIITHQSEYMDSLVARTRLPYTAASRAAKPPVPGDPVNATLLPVFDGASIKEADMRMQTNLLITVLALRAYQAEQSAYPENLDALVSGGYLTRAPADPFSESGDAPLQYRRLADGKYLLYSIGPDGKDNDGTPIQATFANGRPKDWVETDSKGDFVVGINNVRAEKTPDS